MESYKLGEMEEKFAELIWENVPIRSGEQFLKENFEDSLSLFVAAFARKRKLREDEVLMLKKLIDEYERIYDAKSFYSNIKYEPDRSVDDPGRVAAASAVKTCAPDFFLWAVGGGTF